MYEASELPLVVGRTPLMPVDAICKVYSADDPLEAFRRLLLEEPLVQQAIFVASPSLWTAITAWLKDKVGAKSTAPLRALAYLARMSARATPFGLCAGIGFVDIGSVTTLDLDERRRRTRTRPDMELIANAIADLSTGSASRYIRYVASTAVLVRGERLYVTNIQLVDSRLMATEQRPVSLKNTAPVKFVRELCCVARTYDSLVADVCGRFNVTTEEAEQLIETLIETGVIISELRLSPVGDPVDSLKKQLSRLDKALSEKLALALERARAMDEVDLASRSSDMYRDVCSAFSALARTESKSAMQVDLLAPFKGTLSASVLSDAAKLAELYVRMGATNTLTSLRERFVARYEGTYRLVPLLELADANLGIPIPSEIEHMAEQQYDAELLLSTLACEALALGAEEIELRTEELAVLAPEPASATSLGSLEIAFHVVASSHGAINDGQYVIAPSALIGTTGAGKSLGRFWDLFGDDAKADARISALECASDELPVEIVYGPANARNYNVLVRPRILDWELRLGVADLYSNANQIALDDLWMGLDGHRFFIWSQSLRRRIKLIESHVFNTVRLAPNICRLLALIGQDGQRIMRGFNWRSASSFTALPRVKYGRLVLSPRRWRFPSEVFGRSAESATVALRRLSERWNLPRYVYLKRMDQVLLLDLKSAVVGDMLIGQRAKAQQALELQEALPSPGETWLKGASGTHVVEFVASLRPRRSAKANGIEGPRVAPRTINVREKYGPGSDWVYAKFYMGPQAMEDFIHRVIAPMVAGFRELQRLELWFFVRFTDPDGHLRVRLRASLGNRATLRDGLLAIAEKQLTDGVIDRYSLDTYDPEYERYGGLDTIDPVERFFEFDSDHCISYMRQTDHSTDARVAASAESFYSYLITDPYLEDLALAALRARKSRPTESDRRATRRITSAEVAPCVLGLREAIAGDGSTDRLLSLFHMHCNRFGLAAHAELRAGSVLRASLLARKAKSTSQSEMRDGRVSISGPNATLEMSGPNMIENAAWRRL
jgi:thiopeptide-type bacteriocin biosynthesis protein